MKKGWNTNADVETSAFSPNTPHCAPGQLEDTKGGRVGQLFSAQPCYQVS